MQHFAKKENSHINNHETHDFWIDDEGNLLKYRGQSKRIVIPNGIISIGLFAFQKNSIVEQIIIPESVKIIEAFAFNECSKLKCIVIPDSVIEIGEYAFSDCSKLESIVLRRNIKKIGEYAFYGCKAIKIKNRNDIKEIINFYFTEKINELYKRIGKYYE